MPDPFTDEDRARLEGLHGDGPSYGPATRALAHIKELEARVTQVRGERDSAIEQWRVANEEWNRAEDKCDQLEQALRAADELADWILDSGPNRLGHLTRKQAHVYRSARAALPASKGDE